MNTLQIICGYGEDANGKQLVDAKAMLQVARSIVTHATGGVTVTDGEGGWLNPEGQEVYEPVKIFTTFTEKGVDELKAIAALVRDAMMQHSVVATINTQPHFI